MNQQQFLPRDVPLRCVTVCTVVGFVLYAVAFVTPNWLESDPAMNSQFTRLGLWIACFNGYRHPEDYVSKAYYGCWYIYYPEFYYIREWLNPAWFYLVQMIGILAFSCLLLALLLTARIAVKRFISEMDVDDESSRKLLRVSAACHVIATCCIVLQLILLGVQSRERNWMPQPDHNRLGYSYMCACIASFASLFAFTFTVIRSFESPDDQLLVAGEDDYKAPFDEPKPLGAPGVFDSTV